jgi:hypothetical protein
MHARIAADATYLRIDPVSSREQYRWMERYIPMVEDPELRVKLAASIDGKGAFRRFKDVLMSYATERERWFAFRSERLRIFMEAWLNAHALHAVPRPVIVAEAPAPEAASTVPGAEGTAGDVKEVRRTRSSDALRKAVRDLTEALGSRELEMLAAFAEFLKSRRAARSFAHHAEAPLDPAATAFGDGPTRAPTPDDHNADASEAADHTPPAEHETDAGRQA